MSAGEAVRAESRTLGRYALFAEIATGGMASVHLGRLVGQVGFTRTVAIKRLHPHLARDPSFVKMFLEEGRLASRILHPNVVTTLDVVAEDGEVFLVMDFIPGDTLSRLCRKSREAGDKVSCAHVVSVVAGALEGLHAAHEAKSERGAPLGMVHRDVSPQNILVGVDGIARVHDFGVAKATAMVEDTGTEIIKGKVAYMSPEQLAKAPVDRRADVYSAAVVLWEALTGQRLFTGDHLASIVASVMNDEVKAPSELADVPKALDEVVLKGLARKADERWSSAREMVIALEAAMTPSPARRVGEWVWKAGGESLRRRLEFVAEIESETAGRTSLSLIPGFNPSPAPSGPSLPEPSVPRAAGLPRDLALGALPTPGLGALPTPGFAAPPPAAATDSSAPLPQFPSPASAPALPVPSSSPGLAAPASTPSLATPGRVAGFGVPGELMPGAPILPFDERSRTLSRPRRGGALAVAALVVLGLVGAGVGYALLHREPEAPAPAPSSSATAASTSTEPEGAIVIAAPKQGASAAPSSSAAPASSAPPAPHGERGGSRPASRPSSDDLKPSFTR